MGTVNFKGFTTKEVTPNDEFYITSYSATIPDTGPDRFRLRVEGLVEYPFSMSLQELRALQDKREYVTLECIGNPVGGSSISNALWEGVSLKKLLEKANPKPNILKAAFFAAEDYSDSIRVRAFDNAGKVQESSSLIGSLFDTIYPDGARGIQTVKVYVAS